jgi:hypothetical protein
MRRFIFASLLLLLAAGPLSAIDVRISVKFIRDSNGNNPTPAAPRTTDISNPTTFAAEVVSANAILDATQRGYRIIALEYLYIRPPEPILPPGLPANFWYNLDARSNRAVFEAAATADPATWQWRTNAINIYVNNTTSGQCSFSGTGNSISLGREIANGTVLHEIGHFFDLRHTHPGDYDGMLNGWGDGDSLAETLPDDPDASIADVNAFHAAQPAQLRNDLINNVMSYHNETALLPVQMDIWGTTGNGPRFGFVSGKTFFVSTAGLDALFWGESSGLPLRTLAVAQTRVSSPRLHDTILMRPGTYNESVTISSACTLRAANGTVTIVGQP